MKYRSNPLLNEAIEITDDLVNVVFFGAFGVYLHTNERRESQDLDCLIATSITNEDLFQKGYLKYGDRKNGYTTPRHFIIDIFSDRDVNNIQIKTLMDTAKTFIINRGGKRGSVNIKAVNLELLIIMKHRADRTQDRYDLELLARKSYSNINWSYLHSVSNNEFEYIQIKNQLDFYRAN
jgi:hypothetical protein